MYLINGNKLNGSHLSKCVSDNLVAPLFAFKLVALVLLQKMDKISILYQGQTMGKVWDLFWIRYVER